MALNRNQLEQDILAAMKAAAAASSADTAQTTFAGKLADAIDSYVTAGAVRKVEVDITTGIQTQDGKLT